MRCPFCGKDDTQVKDSRASDDGGSIRRRRSCTSCGSRFTTFERIQLRDLTVIKRNGKKIPFERDKLVKSMLMALRKRSVDDGAVERAVNGIVRQLESVGENDIQSKLIGDDPLSEKSVNLMPAIINVVKGFKKELDVFGNNYKTNDGTGVRDYIHIMDLADAHFAAYQFLTENTPQILNLNIGTGQGTSVLELIEKFNKINRCQIIYKFANRRKGDTPYLVADNSLALQLLDWKPFRDIEKMCEDSWNYFKKVLN